MGDKGVDKGWTQGGHRGTQSGHGVDIGWT